jgi:hypothetical protein
MTEFAFDLAKPGDDEGILRLLRENPIPGRISISYERSPSYFQGCEIMGHYHQTLVARHLPSGEIAGLAGRSLRQMYINGEVENVGYLGQLRVDRRFRSRWIVSGGFRFLRELHGDLQTGGYLTTIIEDNREAKGVLVDRARPHFPVYRYLTRLNTLALPVRSIRRPGLAGVEVRRGRVSDLDEMAAFSHHYGAMRQFFPVHGANDFLPESSRMRGLLPSDFHIAVKSGRIAGIIGLWDQSSFKQSVVRGYNGYMRWGRHLCNGLMLGRGFRPLPGPGDEIAHAYAAFVCIADNDRRLFDLLLRCQIAEAFERGLSYLMVGMTDEDPLLPVACSHPHLAYRSRLYSVSWGNGNEFHERLDQRIKHVEIATL